MMNHESQRSSFFQGTSPDEGEDENDVADSTLDGDFRKKSATSRQS